MPGISRAVARLRIVGEDLEPGEISALLGSEPTHSETRGQELPSRSGKAPGISRNGQWSIRASATEPEDFNLQVQQLLAGLSPDLEVWRQLGKRYKIDIFCGWFMSESNEGVDITAETLASLGQRGIALALDIYAPDLPLPSA